MRRGGTRVSDAGSTHSETVGPGNLEKRLAEAVEQQAATSEILRIMSSPDNVQPVFEAIVQRAVRLCDASFSAVARLDDELLHLVAVSNLSMEEKAAFESLYPRPLRRGFAMGRAVLDAEPFQFEDVLSQADYDDASPGLLSTTKFRTFMGVPILSRGRPIGVIGCGRRAVRRFTEREVELVRTFAEQAAIAI